MCYLLLITITFNHVTGFSTQKKKKKNQLCNLVSLLKEMEKHSLNITEHPHCLVIFMLTQTMFLAKRVPSFLENINPGLPKFERH